MKDRQESLPQSASLTAPSSEGALGTRQTGKSLSLMREVARRAGGRENEKLPKVSLPVTANAVTAPLSEGALGMRHKP